MKYFHKLVGENVFLSPLNSEDKEKFTEWINDLEASLYLGAAERVVSLQGEKEALEEMQEGYNFAVVEKSLDELMGSCGFTDVNNIHGTAELGIFIGNKNYWDRGYGTEACRLLLDFGFNILNLNNIMLSVYEYNDRALKCYEKLGFNEIGRRRNAHQVGGQRYDEIYMDMLAEEFEGRILDRVELD